MITPYEQAMFEMSRIARFRSDDSVPSEDVIDIAQAVIYILRRIGPDEKEKQP